MPIYEYECPHCGVFEATQRISERPLRRCPDCRRKVTKLISTTSFQLKGSGWYVTDYARKQGGESKEASASKPADPSPASGSASGNGSTGSGESTGGAGKDGKSSAASSGT